VVHVEKHLPTLARKKGTWCSALNTLTSGTCPDTNVPHAVMFARPLREPRRARKSRSRQFWHAHVERTSPASVSHGLDRAKPSNANKDLQQRNESRFDFLLSDESLRA